MGNSIQFKRHFLSSESRPGYYSILKENLIPSLFYFLTFTLFGMCIGIMGPSMPHLQCQINATPFSMTMVYFLQLGTMLIATLAAGSIVKIIEPHFLLVINCLMLVINTYLVMIARSSSVLAIILIAMGFNMGCIDSLNNVLLVNLYKRNIGPFIQVMHFLYGFGALITQLSIDPFLQYLSTNCSLVLETDIEASENYYNTQITILSHPFWIIGTIELLLFLLLLYIYHLMQKQNVSNTNNINTTKETNKLPAKQPSEATDPDTTKPKPKTNLTCGIVALVGCLCFILDGMQSEYNSFVYTYAVKSSQTEIERSYASFLGFTFWGTLSIGRFAAILISLWCRTSALLIIDMIGLFFGVIMLVCGQGYSDILYVSTCIIGLTLSNTTPGVISLAEEFINLTKWRTTFIIFSASVGEALFPLIFGTLMANVSQIVFPVGNVILVIMIIGNFFTLYKLGATTIKFSEKYMKTVIDVPKTGDTVHVKHYSRMDSVEMI